MTTIDRRGDVVYTYNRLGQVTGVGTHEDAYFYGRYAYHANGSIATEKLHEMDIERTYSYNAAGWLTAIGGDYFTQSLTYTSGGYQGDGYYTGLIASTSYGFSWSSPGTGYPNAPSGYTWRYRYDSRGQLLTAENTLGGAFSVGVGSAKEMQYDAHGNITRFNQGNTTWSNTYFAGTNRMYYNTWLMYNYDASGRISSREASMGIETFTYDPYTGKPATITSDIPVRYGYGGGNQRVLKEVYYTSPNPQNTVYIHGLGDYPLAEYRNHGPDPVTRYVYGPSGLLAIHTGLQGTILFPLKDHLGSARVVLETKPQGGGRQVKPLAVYDYWPFGGDLRVTGGLETTYRYTGQEYEAETDVYNYRARLYAQQLGHFMAPDPAGQFHSPYVAMGNNPVNMVDPDGEWALHALYYAYKAYQYYNYAKAAYNIYQAFDKGGMQGGIQSIFNTAISIGASTVIGGNVHGGYSLAGNMFAGGAGSMISSGILSLSYGGSFRDGLSLNNAFSGIISAGGNWIVAQKKALDVPDAPLDATDENLHGFADKNFKARPGKLGLNRLTIEAPDGYELDERELYSKTKTGLFGSKRVIGHSRGVTRYLGNLLSDVHIAPGNFSSQRQLFLTLGHELIHVSHFNMGLYEKYGRLQRGTYFEALSHRAAYDWQYLYAHFRGWTQARDSFIPYRGYSNMYNLHKDFHYNLIPNFPKP